MDPMDATQSAEKHGESRSARCRARSKRSGERCRRLAIPGGAVCVVHGGAAPQTARAALQRLLRARARREVWKLRFDMERMGMTAKIAPPTVEDLRLAVALDRLRVRNPTWFARVHDTTSYRAERAPRRAGR
jgi:hypothetical protein